MATRHLITRLSHNSFITPLLRVLSRPPLVPLSRCESSSTHLDLSGIFPPIATPFLDNEFIGFDKLDENLEKWNKIQFRGYAVLGSNGEAPYLREDEKVELVRHVASKAPPGKVIMAGCGCESTRDTLALVDRAAEVGAHCALIVTPAYYKASMTHAAFIHHYTQVADSSPIPIILYSVPGNTTIDLDTNVIIHLSQHRNIIGVKDSGGDIMKLTKVVHETRDNHFQVLAGSAGFLYPALSVGCVGGVCTLANILGSEVCKLYDLYRAGRLEEAKALQQSLVNPNTEVTKTCGVPGLKRAMDMMGYYGGPVRSPLLPLGQSQEDKLREVFKGFG